MLRLHIPNVDLTIDCSVATDTEFVPSWGKVYVDKDWYGKYIYQWMYWSTISRVKWFIENPDSTFEPDALFNGYGSGYPEPPHPKDLAPVGPGNSITVYGYLPRNISHGNESDYGGYWSSDLPRPYQDTDWQVPLTSSPEWAVTVGSAQASLLSSGRVYFTVTRMFDGGPQTGNVKLSAQRGRLAIPTFPSSVNPYGKWNSYGCSAVNNIYVLRWEDDFYAPGCRQYWYKWTESMNAAC